jgi:hypothetical protein
LNAKASEINSTAFELNAKASEINSKAFEMNARASTTNAATRGTGPGAAAPK